ncbi:hypothetical protein D3C76_403860 [compost metagenome]
MDVIEKGTLLICTVPHPDGDFTRGKVYKVNAISKSKKYKGTYVSIRVRDDKRQRKDFNLIPTSKNYIYSHFFVMVK